MMRMMEQDARSKVFRLGMLMLCLPSLGLVSWEPGQLEWTSPRYVKVTIQSSVKAR